MQKKSFRERFFNKKGLLILAGLILVIGAGGGVAVLKASESPDFCSTCHIMEPYYDSWHNSESNLLASKHAVEDVDCHQCHEPDLSTQIHELFVFVTGNYEVPLEKREFKQEFCLECHSETGEATTWEEAKEATDFQESNPHDSHNTDLECNACHNMHQPSQVFCAECHYFDWMDDLDNGWTQDAN
ncbi:cytochrome c3 family protein [Syntrophomonas erecta]